jgi:hypothetical protein
VEEETAQIERPITMPESHDLLLTETKGGIQ